LELTAACSAVIIPGMVPRSGGGGGRFCGLIVTPFRRWNDIGIHNHRKVISISGFRASSWLLDTNMIVLQSAINEETFEVLYNALLVTQKQLSPGHIINVAEVT